MISFKTLGVLATLLASTIAWSYIPPDWFVLRNIASQRAGHRLVRIKSQLSAGDDMPGFHAKTLTELNYTSRTMRITVSDSEGKDLYRKEFPLGQVSERAKISMSGLLFDSSSEGIYRVLQASNVKVHGSEAIPDPYQGQRALGRWNKHIAWIIGGDPKVIAQLWVEKDSFNVLRWLKDGVRAEFEKFRTVRDFTFPTQLTFSENDRVILREEVRELFVDSDTKGAQMPFESGWTSLGNSLSQPEKEVILGFVAALR